MYSPIVRLCINSNYYSTNKKQKMIIKTENNSQVIAAEFLEFNCSQIVAKLSDPDSWFTDGKKGEFAEMISIVLDLIQNHEKAIDSTMHPTKDKKSKDLRFQVKKIKQLDLIRLATSV